MKKLEFEVISVSATKRWTDEKGKPRQQTKRFYQTLNPFNKMPDGAVKTKEQIRDQITAARDAWLAEDPNLPPEEGGEEESPPTEGEEG